MSGEQRIIIITGSNGGIGQAIAERFYKDGCFIIGIDLGDKNLSQCHEYFQLDLRHLVEESVSSSLYDKVMKVCNDAGAIPSVIVNNAAVQILKKLSHLETKDMTDSLSVNVIPAFALVKLFQKELMASKGAVINIGSVHSHQSKPGFCAYAVSKAAISGLTRGLALEFGGAVTVNTVSPGAVGTALLLEGFEDKNKLDELSSFQPVGRIARPDEIADAVYFLSMNNSRFITGSELVIDGGVGIRLHDPV